MTAADRITIYEKPTCTTCRQVHGALRDAGVDFDAVDYYLEPLTVARLRDLIRKTGLAARDLLRTREPMFAEVNPEGRDLSDSEAIDLMIRYPDLLQRPIVERGDRAILARPAERLGDFLKEGR